MSLLLRFAFALLVIGVLLRYLAGQVYDPALGNFGLACAGFGIALGAASIVGRLERWLEPRS
jgi:hypothetical protein